MLAIAKACAIVGLDGEVIEVQVDFNPRAAIPTFTIVGLPGSAVKESRERVRAAIKNSKLSFPNKAYVVNLSPADLPKQGPAYDLAIAIGVLAATDQVPLACLEKSMFIGELALDGSVRHVKGVLAMVYAAQQAGYEAIYVPKVDADEAALIPGIVIYGVESLGQLVEHLYDLNPIRPHVIDPERVQNLNRVVDDFVDFMDIKGQEHVKRALEIAAAGNHNLIMTGPPGAGKSLIAKAMPGILPRLNFEESIEVTRIYSVADLLDADHPLMVHRPFRAPHHTISQAGLVGGGSNPKPGEISLAHRGVLFLDEIVEYSIKTLEVMRQPIEDKLVTISRAKGSLTFPANFILLAARNPCPCGYYGDTVQSCNCPPGAISRYQSRLSGPLMDRIDMHLEVQRVDYEKLLNPGKSESSQDVRARVEAAREVQYKRFQEENGIYANGDMNAGQVEKYCPMTPEAKSIIELSMRKLQMSARSFHRVLKLSRTIADLDHQEIIGVQHVAEALQYRPKN